MTLRFHDPVLRQPLDLSNQTLATLSQVHFFSTDPSISEEEPSTMEVPPLTQASAEGITEVQVPANPTDSLDSFDSINVIPTNQNPRPQVVAPETFNIASPTADGQVHPEEVIEPETEDRKSISSNLQ